MHKLAGKLYGVTITGHREYCLPCFPNRLKPSVHNPRYTFLLSCTNSGYVVSKLLHLKDVEYDHLWSALHAISLVGLCVRTDKASSIFLSKANTTSFCMAPELFHSYPANEAFHKICIYLGSHPVSNISCSYRCIHLSPHTVN